MRLRKTLIRDYCRAEAEQSKSPFKGTPEMVKVKEVKPTVKFWLTAEETYFTGEEWKIMRKNPNKAACELIHVTLPEDIQKSIDNMSVFRIKTHEDGEHPLLVGCINIGQEYQEKIMNYAGGGRLHIEPDKWNLFPGGRCDTEWHEKPKDMSWKDYHAALWL